MKCIIKNANRTTSNLTRAQVISRYVKGMTPDSYVPMIEMLLSRLDRDNGKYVWPNAKLCFTRTGEDSYTVERA